MIIYKYMIDPYLTDMQKTITDRDRVGLFGNILKIEIY